MSDERARAERFADLFRAVYLTFHRRDGPRSQLPGASRAVLEYLALAGPLTVGEAAAHMTRAQSVMTRLPASQAEDLIIGLRALIDLAGPAPETRNDPLRRT